MTDIVLNNGVTMPRIGLGTGGLSDAELPALIHTAYAAGYRGIDTAALYGNETGVGDALTDLPRDEMFVTTKVWQTDHGHDSTLTAFDASLARLRLDHVDLYLIHWPAPARDLYVDTWRALERLHTEGRARAIGVSNFHTEHLQRLAAETGTVPAVNQIELHPWLTQTELRAYHTAHGITTEAWSPLRRAQDLLDDPVIARIAAAHDATPAQTVLRWHLQHGHAIIPKTSNPQRLTENIDLFGFQLSDTDMAHIDALDTGARRGQHPDTVN